MCLQETDAFLCLYKKDSILRWCAVNPYNLLTRSFTHSLTLSHSLTHSVSAISVLQFLIHNTKFKTLFPFQQSFASFQQYLCITSSWCFSNVTFWCCYRILFSFYVFRHCLKCLGYTDFAVFQLLAAVFFISAAFLKQQSLVNFSSVFVAVSAVFSCFAVFQKYM